MHTDSNRSVCISVHPRPKLFERRKRAKRSSHFGQIRSSEGERNVQEVLLLPEANTAARASSRARRRRGGWTAPTLDFLDFTGDATLPQKLRAQRTRSARPLGKSFRFFEAARRGLCALVASRGVTDLADGWKLHRTTARRRGHSSRRAGADSGCENLSSANSALGRSNLRAP